MRQGIPAAGNFLQQELAILTGSVEAMVVDVQCIMQALVELATNFHTKIITTSPKVNIKGATHIEFDEHQALTIAKQILREAIDNYKNRGETQIPDVREDLVPGFSHEYINYMLGGSYRASFRPLNDAIMSGRIRGVAAIVGCNNPRSQHDYLHTYVTEQLLKQDVLVVETGCGAIASAKMGYLLGDKGMEGRPGPARDSARRSASRPCCTWARAWTTRRILTVLTQMVEEGGLGDDIDQVPAVGLAPEWMSEKALSIGTYCVASGAYVIFGGSNPGERHARSRGRQRHRAAIPQRGLGKAVRRQDGIRRRAGRDGPAHAGPHRQEARCSRPAGVRCFALWPQRRRPDARTRRDATRRAPGGNLRRPGQVRR